MFEAKSLAGRIRIHFENRPLEPPERLLVHDDRYSGSLEATALVGGVLLDGDPESGSPASQYVADAEDRVREVGLGSKAVGRFRGDREGNGFGGHRMIL